MLMQMMRLLSENSTVTIKKMASFYSGVSVQTRRIKVSVLQIFRLKGYTAMLKRILDL